MGYEKQKKWMLSQFPNKLGDEDGGGAMYVAACTYHGTVGDDEHSTVGNSQACHAHVPHMSSRFTSLDVMLDHIQGGSRAKIEGVQTPEESIAYLQYFMDHPIFSKSFLEHDAEVAFKERIMVRDITTLPSNVCMFAIIATRALWESYQIKIPHRMAVIRKYVGNADLAYLLSWYLDDSLSQNMLINSGHTAVATDKLTVGGVKNYIKHKVTHAVPSTLAKGYSHMVEGKYNVYSTFEPKYIQTWGRPLVTADLFSDFLQGKKITPEMLKEIEEMFCE